MVGCNPPDFTSEEDASTIGPPGKRTIRSFMDTVVPGAPTNHPDIDVVFYEPAYGFAKYRRILLLDLKKRSKRLFGNRQFSGLSYEQRAAVIKSGLRAGDMLRKLYSASIYVTQVTVFTGFYKTEESCSLIDFKAKFEPGAIKTSYSNFQEFAGRPLTNDGNYH